MSLPPNQYFADRWNPETVKNLLLSFGAGAGASGLYHSFRGLTSAKPKKKHTKFFPGPQAADEEKKAQNGPTAWSDPSFTGNFLHGGVLNVAGSALAAMGGAHAMNKLVRQNKKQKYEEQIEEARKMYEESLRGEKVAALHGAFAAYDKLPQEKKADWTDTLGNITSAIGKAYDATIRAPGSPVAIFNRSYGRYAGATAGLSAALGAGLAYDFGKQRTQAAAIQRAQEARARMSALPPMWVEPDAAVLRKRKQQQSEEQDEAPAKAASA